MVLPVLTQFAPAQVSLLQHRWISMLQEVLTSSSSAVANSLQAPSLEEQVEIHWTFTGTIASESVVKAGDGNDTLLFGSGDYQSSQIFLGGGRDSIVIGNNTETVSGSDGTRPRRWRRHPDAGRRSISTPPRSLAVVVLTPSPFRYWHESSVLINLDSTVNGGGGDTLNLSDAIGETALSRAKAVPTSSLFPA